MTSPKIVIKTRAGKHSSVLTRVLGLFEDRPAVVLGATLAVGALCGLGAGAATGLAGDAVLQARLADQQAELAQVRAQSQAEVNALAARMAELQAQATRLNALGERLTQMGELADGEFDFQETPGVGGGEESGPVQDVRMDEVNAELQALGSSFDQAGKQLGVLDSLLFDQQLQRDAIPSRLPIHNSYVTSGFGGRNDPFGRGRGNHKGLDFSARVGDPVLSVADGVVKFSGVNGAYGNVVDIDHGNGYVTRYAHNSRLSVRVGDLVRAGQEVAKAGSTGRSTGAHVHFEVWENGVAVNPRKFLGTGGNTPVRRG